MKMVIMMIVLTVTASPLVYYAYEIIKHYVLNPLKSFSILLEILN